MYPYSDDERENTDTETALNSMVEDRLYWQERDPEFRSYVDNSFKSVYGDNAAEQDATGRTVSPTPRAVTLPPFRPSVTPEDTALSGGVGDHQPNAWHDVLKVQKGLSNTNHYTFDMAKERSGEHSPTLAQAIRNFQREKKEEIDGIVLPGGPTITRMKESLFGENSSRSGRTPKGDGKEEAVVPVISPPASEREADSPSVVPTQYTGKEAGGSRPGPTSEFPILPRGRYPRDPHGLDDPRHPFDPTKPIEPPKTIGLSEKDVELIARLIEAEAGVHSDLGKQGVLFVVLNSMAVGPKFGGPTAIGAMNYPNRFATVREVGGDVRRLPGVSPENIARVKQWIEQIQSGQLTDPTDGALYFLNREEARKQAADFGADVEPLMVIGSQPYVHHFYNRYQGKSAEYVPPYTVNYASRGARDNQNREGRRRR